MFNSKFFCVIIVLTALALGAALFLQVQEMLQYDLITALQERYFPSSGGSAEPAKEADKAEEKSTKPADKKNDAKK